MLCTAAELKCWLMCKTTCLYVMAVAAILNFEKRLPFRYYLTNHRQI